MSERRIQATVIGPARPGLVKIELGSGNTKHAADIPVDRIPPHLRIPNSVFLAVMFGGELVRVEDFDQQLIDTQERIRAVLNTQWNPIGAAHAVDDEYDSYISGIMAFLEGGATADQLAEHLRLIEVDQMTLRESPWNKLLAVAEALCSIQLRRRGPSYPNNEKGRPTSTQK